MDIPSHNSFAQQFSVCPVCNKKYQNAQMTIVQWSQQRSGLHITCPHCQMSVIIAMTQNPSGMMSVGMMTDLDREDAHQLLAEEVISTNTILNLYQALQKTDINMIDVLTNHQKNTHTVK